MTENIKYKVLMFIRYLGDSFFYPFFALYLSIPIAQKPIILIANKYINKFFTSIISIKSSIKFL